MLMLKYTLDQGAGRLCLVDDETSEEKGFLSYEVSPTGVADAQHTVVKPAYRGQGVAEELAKAFFVLAQEHGWQVRPSCSYVARYMDRHPELEGLRE